MPQPSLSGKKRKAASEEKDSGSGQRPERTGAAEKFYSKSEASKYEQNSRMATTQRHLAERALHLIDLKEGVPALLLDVGCGTGYSGRPLEKAGHTWIGTDISDNMLSAARAPTRRRDVVCADVGVGLGYRKGSFDGAVSVSAVQWLCVATRPEHDPYKRCKKFFVGLHAVLAPNARAALQIYPEEPTHMEMLRDAALKAGFDGPPSMATRRAQPAVPGLGSCASSGHRQAALGGSTPSGWGGGGPPDAQRLLRVLECAAGCSRLELAGSEVAESATFDHAGGLVIDYPTSECSKKMFLVLVAKPRPPKPQRDAKGGKGGKGGKGAKGGGKGAGKGAKGKAGKGGADGGKGGKGGKGKAKGGGGKGK